MPICLAHGVGAYGGWSSWSLTCGGGVQESAGVRTYYVAGSAAIRLELRERERREEKVGGIPRARC